LWIIARPGQRTTRGEQNQGMNETAGDTEAIIATVTDYWEGWFDGDAVRMERALHAALAKTGVTPDPSGIKVSRAMTATEMVGWTRDGEGVAEKPADFAYEITVNDAFRDIATVTVRSGVYREYLQLVRGPEGWRILNALYTRVGEV
jgi:hypothetical protein